jgi:pyruvate dehydrogenase E1 component
LLDEHDDSRLHRLMTNLGGHDLSSLLDAFHEAGSDDRPTCFIAYTIKGFGLPFAGHKDNHAGMMSPEQVEELRRSLGVTTGDEWDPYAGMPMSPDAIDAFLSSVPFGRSPARRYRDHTVAVPESFEPLTGETMSTQQAFGRLLADIGRAHPELADRMVTTAPDVTVSTNLGGWVNRRGIFDRVDRADTFKNERIASPQNWSMSPAGQHIELGIAESNLFILLAALGLSESLFGSRLLPIGTVYDPFISRGLDALNYACYQDARFILAGTPSGISLAPEGGAHQSVYTPLIGMTQPGLTSFEPALVDELSVILRWSFVHLQQEQGGGAVYLRLSTRPVEQIARTMTAALQTDILAGGYWLVPPATDAELAIVATGAVLPEARQAHRELAEDLPGLGLLVVTSPGLLEQGWRAALHKGGPCHIEQLLSQLPPSAGLVTVADAAPAMLGWLGAVCQQRVIPLGVDTFGQSGDIPDLYAVHGLDADAIIGAAARLLVPQA